MDNKYSKELAHFSLGEILSGHKWVRREENTNGQKSKYRYWYDNVANSISNAISSFSSAWKAGIPKSVRTAATNYQTKVYNTISNGYKFLNRYGSDYYDAVQNLKDLYLSPMYKGIVSRVTNTDTVWRGKYDPFPVNIAMHSSDYGVYVPKQSDGVKYVGKIKLDNGKTRYYYDYDAFRRGCEIYKYQSNEPAFMKKLKETDAEKPTTQKEDASAVNPGHGSEGKYRTVNCVKCTIAYELRRRGYDVQAPDSASLDKSVDDYHDAFGIKVDRRVTRSVKIEGTETINTYKELEKNEESPLRDFTKLVKQGDDYYLRQTYSPNESSSIKTVNIAEQYSKYGESFNWMKPQSDNVSKAIVQALQNKIDEFPNSSRGDMNINWYFGSGHSLVWEKDQNGDTKVIDTQIDEVLYDSTKGLNSGRMVEIVKAVDPTKDLELYRYDNLQITNSEILSWVEEKT